MATRDEVYQAIRSADAAGDSESVRKLGDYLKTLDGPDLSSKPQTYLDRVASNGKAILGEVGDLAGGAVRGAAGIGATLLQPLDATGITSRTNAERRAGIDEALGTLGANKDSLSFKTGKLGAEIAGTAGVGGVLGKAAQLARAPAPLVNALTSSGFTTGAAPVNGLARAADIGTRMVGGGITGATSAGLVDPSSALTGGAIGAAMPPVLGALGQAGAMAGRVLRGPEQTPAMAAAVDAARQSGYVIPPSQANPSLLNRAIEGFSGKLTTAQNASARNQAVTNAKAARDLGLPPDVQLTPEVIADNLKARAKPAYDAVKGSGTVTPGKPYQDALDAIEADAQTASQGFPNAPASPVIALVKSLRSNSFDARSAVAKIQDLRQTAKDEFRPGGNTALARASKEAATALEDALETHLAQNNMPDALQQFREARTLYAKSSSVENALNKETGTVNAAKLAAELDRKKPLSGDLKEIAQFASRFKKAVQVPENMGSLPGSSPLDWHAGAAASMLAGNPSPMASVLARPIVRSLALSPLVQNRLVQGPPQLGVPDALSVLGYRAAPLIVTDR